MSFCFGPGRLRTIQLFWYNFTNRKMICFSVTHNKMFLFQGHPQKDLKVKVCMCACLFYYFDSALEPRMYLDHEVNCIGDISPS